MWGRDEKNRLNVWRVGDQPDPPMEATPEVTRRRPGVVYDCLMCPDSVEADRSRDRPRRYSAHVCEDLLTVG